MCLCRDILGNSTMHALTNTKIQKVGPPAPASSTRFQAYKACLFPFSFLFQHKQMYIHTGEHSRTSRPTSSSWWSSRGTSSSRYRLLCIRIKSCYSVVLYLLWNLCNNHPFLGDTVVFQVQHVKCWVTVAKVRTFAVSKCVHNLSQTSNSIGKLISTK